MAGEEFCRLLDAKRLTPASSDLDWSGNSYWLDEVVRHMPNLPVVCGKMGLSRLDTWPRRAVKNWPVVFARIPTERQMLEQGHSEAAKGYRAGLWTKAALARLKAEEDAIEARQQERLASDVLLLATEPGADARVIMLDLWDLAWRCTSGEVHGTGIVALGAWRWNVSRGRAARRIATYCGEEIMRDGR